MHCTRCGAVLVGDAGSCGNCGAAQADQPRTLGASASSFPVAPIVASGPQIRPWVRYWARLLDVLIVILVGGGAVEKLAPGAFSGSVSRQFLGPALLLAWVFVEALALSTLRFTPGKWLLKVHVTPSEGTSISYSRALERSLNVWWRGVGLGFPLVGMFTLAFAHQRLTEDGSTSWDREGDFVVSHERIGARRVAVVVTIVVIVVAAVFAEAGTR